MSSPVVIVTGASRGIGLAIVRVLLKATPAVRLVTVARSKFPEELNHDRLVHIEGDISAPDVPALVVQKALDTFGRLDSVIINHGVLDPTDKIAGVSTLQEWKTAFDVNFFSAVALLKAAVPELRKTKGRVILVSSGAAVNGYAGWGAYSATKAAMNSLGRTLATEEPDITNISVRPGVVDTQMQKDIRENQKDAMGEAQHGRFVKLHEEGQLLRPDQPGTVIANLALSAPRKLSGQFLSWDSPEFKDFH